MDVVADFVLNPKTTGSVWINFSLNSCFSGAMNKCLQAGEMLFPEMHTLEAAAAAAFCGRSRCLTHMAAVCITLASFTFSALLTSSQHHPSLCHHHHSCRLWATLQFHSLCAFLLCGMFASSYLPPYHATSLPRPVFFYFTSITLPTKSPSICTTSCSHPSPFICTSYTPPCLSSPILPSCLSKGPSLPSVTANTVWLIPD